MSEKAINKQFKILYALGIFFVVAGHYANGGVNFFFDWFKPYAFHLGLFVFGSGYFYSKENENRVGCFVWSRLKKLIIPLYAWNLFYAGLVLVLNGLGFEFPIQVNVYNLLIAPLNDGHQFIFNLASWFIVPFFMVQVFAVVLRKLLSKTGIKNEWVIFAIFLVIGMIGIGLASKGYYTGNWLVLSRFCYFLPFFAIGYLYKTVLEEKADKVASTIYFTVVFGIQALVMIIYGDAYAYTPSKCNNFDNAFMPIMIGVLGIAFWVRCAKLLVPVVGDSKVVRLVADNTYSIMMHHFLGLFLIKCFFAIIKYYGIACSSFDLEVFKSTPLYVYIPFGINAFAVFMVLGSMAFSIAFGKIPKVVSKNVCKR